ncbi:hypothetical protein DCS32_05115 [Dokdonia sp. Dokd-P16]|uniref:thiamine-binding protein n=1 Tax=Dokdonia sp. Dokd-P16 TaxID=2173169 RepID=UPI000D5434A7|nr:thiamine-binding protein [Dokdonia sp. Dokd-P16]AWH73556.1 hypothetical protein DCS32_05115 [Dokdonia sp. Dokd-P16]
MQISVDLTFSPLQNDYEMYIISIIKRLRDSGLTIVENPLATQVYGDYDKVMTTLTKEMKRSFEEIGIGLFYIKIVKTDRSDYVADF